MRDNGILKYVCRDIVLSSLMGERENMYFGRYKTAMSDMREVMKI